MNAIKELKGLNFLPAIELLQLWHASNKIPLSTVSNYGKCYIHTLPGKKTTHPHYNVEQDRLIVEEVRDLLEKGAVSLLSGTEREGFYSNLFLVPKKDGGQRPVINLKALNQFIQPEHFKMEGIHTLKDIVKPKDWMPKIDLKDAYFTIPIHTTQRKYLKFVVSGQTYKFNCLPFGLSSAPWVFTKTLKPVAALLQEMGVRMIVYIDDILILAETKKRAQEQAEALVYLLECLGFIVNMKKSVLSPAQIMDFLGLTVDTVLMQLKLPGEKLKKIRAEARKLEREGRASARALSRLIGKMNATSQVIPPAPLFYRNLQMSCTQALERNFQNYDSELTLSQEDRIELKWWDSHMGNWNGKTLIKREINLTIESDVSLGSSLSGSEDWRSLDGRGSPDAHKLSGTFGSNLSNIHETEDRSYSPTDARQHISNCIHQQPWRYCLLRSGESSQKSVAVVPGEEHLHHSSTLTRSIEQDSGCRISYDERPYGLETESSDISENRTAIGPNRGGSVCVQLCC